MSACPRCDQRGKTWEGGDPVCGFPTRGEFSRDNWMCATMDELRELVEPDAIWSNDQHAGVLAAAGDFLVLGWYKSRGRTESAVILDSDLGARPLTWADAERFITDHDVRRPTP